MLRPRLRTVLISLNLLVLALPLAGIQVMRLYESALVRQTESELIAQAAFIAAAYRSAFDRVLAYEPASQAGQVGSELERHSRAPASLPASNQGWQYRAPVLDLADSKILPPQPEPAPLPDGMRPDSLAYIIGQDLESILKDAQRMTLAAIRIVDYQGVVVATTGEDRYLQLSDTEEVALALEGRHVSRLRRKEEVVTSAPSSSPLQAVSRTTRIRAFVTTPIMFEERIVGVVLLSRTPANIVQALSAKRRLLAYAAALLLGVVVLIAFITSRMVVRPIKNIQELARRVSQGDERAMDNIKPGGTAEIVELGEQIAEMGKSLEDRRRYVQEFARHVSHEFKTPLTALRGAIEMFEDHGEGMNTDQRQTFLRNMDGDVTHLNRLTTSLLQLAKADMQEPAQDTITNLNDLLQELVQTHLQNRKEHSGIRCTMQLSLPDEQLMATVSAEAIDAALTQLIDNAIVHGKTTSQICLSLQRNVAPERPSRKDRGSPQTAWIDITDNGGGISEGNRAKALQPFFTTAREHGGTGLGLAIASRLVASQRGSLTLLPATAETRGIEGPREATGASFRIELPLAD